MSTWILVPGHGGLSPGGIYLTKGKRSPKIPPGIYEGAFNREVCRRVERMCISAAIPCVVANPGPMNPTLRQRVAYCNAVHAKTKDCVVISIHANAAGKSGQWHDARGTVAFHSPTGSLKSKALAHALVDKIAEFCSPLTSRGVKARRFAMVTKTKCPAVLLECGFMDNLKDVTYLASFNGQDQLATAIFHTIEELNE